MGPRPLLGACRPDLGRGWCLAGNASGLCSTALWFVVLLPQIVHNSRQKSVEGLSYAWSVANFSASCINLFFVLRKDMPSYVLISAVYMPVLEYIIVWQFVLYGNRRLYGLGAAVISATLGAYAAANVLAWHSLSDFACAMEWVAILLWSVETVPQLWVNYARGSTDGQAPGSVMIAWLGKTTDFLSMFLLVLPAQNVLKTYFSTSTSYCNVLQFFLLASSLQTGARRAGALLVALMLAAGAVLLGLKMQAFWVLLGPSAISVAVFGGYAMRSLLARRCSSIGLTGPAACPSEGRLLVEA